MDSMNKKEKNYFIFQVIESLCLENEYKYHGHISIEDLVNYVYAKVNDNETNINLRQLFDALKELELETIFMRFFIQLPKKMEMIKEYLKMIYEIHWKKPN